MDRKRFVKWPFYCLIFLFVLAIFGPWISSYQYCDIQLSLKNTPPNREFWFGTDELGRDVFSRIWWGARISLFIGVTAAMVDMIIGIFWGSVAAYSGGKVEETMMRICDILHSIPYLLVVILLTVFRGPGIFTILIAMTITGWINMARICRSQVLQLKNQEYVMAAKVLGASHFRILFMHILPNAMGPIIAAMTLTIPSAIFTEAFLSFLGLGIQAPSASWGVMLNDGISALSYYPWRLFFPAAFITFTIFCFNVLGNSLRDAWDS
jgi:oligopeptide transport system permease protein